MDHLFSVLAAGALAGFVSSVLGIGGGVILVPVLAVVFGFKQPEAMATSLGTIALITAYNTLRFQTKKQIYWKGVLYIAAFAMLCSFLAGYIAHFLPDFLLVIFFILFVLAMLYKTLRKNKLAAVKPADEPHLSVKLSAVIGTFSGTVAGLTGVGGGAVTTPLLMAYGRLPHFMVVPLSNAVMFFTAVAGTAGYAIQDVAEKGSAQTGYVHLDIVFLLFISALPAAYLGTRFQDKIAAPWRRGMLIAVLLIIAVRMILKLV